MGKNKITKSKYTLSAEEQKACHKIIHAASISSAGAGAGLAQIPLADTTIITPIQITMIVSLGKVFEQEITKSIAKGLLGGFIASFVGRGVAQVVWGWVPGIGNASNAITAAAITESVGWLCVDHFYKERYLTHKKSEKDFEESTSGKSKENFKPNQEKREDLKKRADDFISGRKSATSHKTEYFKLLEDFNEILDELQEGDELRQIHIKLLGKRS